MDSLTTSLMLVNGKRFDPIFDATLGPAMAWSVAHWLNVIPKKWIMLWKKMVRRLEATTMPWARADGLAAVVYLSMKRVGVQMPAPFVMLFLEDGAANLRSVNFYYEAPETVRVLVCRACEMWQWAKLAASRTATPFEGLNDQVLWKPPLAVAKNEAGGISANDAAAFRACLTMQLWPKDRKALHGLPGDDSQLCDLCCEGLDSLEHRNWECARTAAFRAEVIEQFPNRYRNTLQRRDRLFLDLGLVTGSFPVLPTLPGSHAGCTLMAVRSSPLSLSCEDVGNLSSVSTTGWTGECSTLPQSALQPVLCMGHSRGSSTPFQPLRPWLCCALCEMLILHCRLGTIARSWVTLGEEEVEMARRQNHRQPICGGRFGPSSISRAGKSSSACSN